MGQWKNRRNVMRTAKDMEALSAALDTRKCEIALFESDDPLRLLIVGMSWIEQSLVAALMCWGVSREWLEEASLSDLSHRARTLELIRPGIHDMIDVTRRLRNDVAHDIVTQAGFDETGLDRLLDRWPSLDRSDSALADQLEVVAENIGRHREWDSDKLFMAIVITAQISLASRALKALLDVPATTPASKEALGALLENTLTIERKLDSSRPAT